MVAALGTVQTALRGLCIPRGQRDPATTRAPLLAVTRGVSCPCAARCREGSVGSARPWAAGSRPLSRPQPGPYPRLSRVGARRSMSRRSQRRPGRARRWIGAACPAPRKALRSNRGRGGAARYGDREGKRGTQRDRRGHRGTRGMGGDTGRGPQRTAGGSAAAAGPGALGGSAACGAGPELRAAEPLTGSPAAAGIAGGAQGSAWGERAPGAAGVMGLAWELLHGNAPVSRTGG